MSMSDKAKTESATEEPVNRRMIYYVRLIKGQGSIQRKQKRH